MSAASKIEAYDLWMPRILRLISAVVGLGMIIAEFEQDKSAHLIAYVVGGLLAGVPGIGLAESLLSKAGSGWPLESSSPTHTEGRRSESTDEPTPSAGTRNGKHHPKA